MKKSAGLWLLLPLVINGCDWITNTANSIGDHLPVLGERCEHWQCFTSSGQTSEENQKGNTAASAPAPSNQNSLPPQMQDYPADTPPLK